MAKDSTLDFEKTNTSPIECDCCHKVVDEVIEYYLKTTLEKRYQGLMEKSECQNSFKLCKICAQNKELYFKIYVVKEKVDLYCQRILKSLN